MDQRKLIGFGRDSYIVSLPKKWVQDNKLKKGDRLFVDYALHELKISVSDMSSEKKRLSRSIDITKKNEERIKTEIVTAYLNCVDEIIVRGDGLADHSILIKNQVAELPGFEIMEVSNTKIIAHDVLNLEEINVHDTIRRIDMMLRAMMDDVLACRCCKKECMVMKERDKDVNRLVFLVYRILNSVSTNYYAANKLGIKPQDIYKLSLIVMRLEKIGDNIKRICYMLQTKNIKEKARKEIIDRYSRIKKEYTSLMSAYYASDKEKAITIITGISNLTLELNNFLEKNPEVSIARIVEYQKSMVSAITHIGRTILGSIG